MKKGSGNVDRGAFDRSFDGSLDRGLEGRAGLGQGRRCQRQAGKDRQDEFLGTGFTGVGSIREGHAFRIDPDLVRSLSRGEAIVVTKVPKFKIDYVKLDYFENIHVEDMMKKIKDEKNEARERLSKKDVKEGETREFKTLQDTLHKFQKGKEEKK